MFLKKMILKGFKSFADPTSISFNDGLTVIIGPNGSGKSNINDALKWVLGETSKKTLRATDSKDVIFSGTSTVGSAEYAEVSLYFDNEKGTLDYEGKEIIVTRKAYLKKNQNEYFINNQMVRRKDIKNLFLDTGLGNTDLSIISQGSVSKITESKPEQLRELLREAAGVSKYQQQKKETLSKLEIVSSDLNILEVKLKSLEKQLKPLEGAREKAEKYNKLKKDLRDIELPLLKHYLTTAYKDNKELEKKLEENNFLKSSITQELTKINEQLKEFQPKIIQIEKEVDSWQIKQNELQNNLTKLEKVDGDENVVADRIKHFAKSIKELKDIIASSRETEEKINQEISTLKTQQFSLTSQNEQDNSKLTRVEIELTKLLEKQNNLGRGTRKIIENKDIFDKVYGTVDDLISYDEKYELAINLALGAKTKNVVVKNEDTIKEAIKFLKDNKMGNATFIPNDKIKVKSIGNEFLDHISRINGYIGTLDQFIKVSPEFKILPSNLAGNIILFTDINSALAGAKFINYKYMFITLDGDIIYPGFTVKGGYNVKFNYKEEIEKYTKAKELLNKKINQNLNQLNNLSETIRELSAKRNNAQNEEIRVSERLNYLETQFQQALHTYKKLTAKDFNFKELDSYLENENFDQLSLEQITNKIRTLNSERQALTNKLIELQDQQSNFNQKWSVAIEKISDLKVNISNNQTKIENSIDILHNDYKLSYDELKTKDLPKLTGDIEENQKNRLNIREQIKDLGFIDTESIEKYNKLFEEYSELKINVEELKTSREKLLTAIEIADKEMLIRIKDTFTKVNERFDAIFKMLFRGGNAKIIFSQPDDILESGVEIIASAPGKKIRNIRLYSGGEKSLIALSLIFAINEVNNLPLLLLDEVEAALDEANVERFAKFAKELNETTQLIIVSHRPGTMEQADFLYGVTMQRKGITDVFNVKIDNALELID